MKGSRSVSSPWLVVFLLLVGRIECGFTLQQQSTTVPAFLWFSHPQQQDSSNEIKDVINYRTISQKDLAKVILSEGGWSSLLCQGANLQQAVDIGLIFVGRELQSSDISRSQSTDPTLMHLLKDSFTRSKFSMAFPYISPSEENKTMETSLISGFTESCGNGLGVKSIAFLESCSVDGGDFQKLADMHSVHDHLDSVLKNKQKGQKDLIVLCSGGSDSSEGLDLSLSEGEVFSELVNHVEKSGASYSVLYASDPNKSVQYPSSRALDRFLSEGTVGNGSLYSSLYCDGVCQIKSSLLEGLLVAIVLLIILISGLCCMMGIDTPTRFETPQDS